MSTRAIVPDRHFLIEQRRPDAHGYRRRTIYTGNPRQISKGWRIIRSI